MEDTDQKIEIDNLVLLDEFNKETLLNNIYNRYYIFKIIKMHIKDNSYI